MRLEHFLRRHYVPTRLPAGAQNTVDGFLRSIRRLSRILGRPARVKDLTARNVGRVVQSVVLEGKSLWTADGYRIDLVALWSLANRMGLRKEPPCCPKLRGLPKRVPVAWLRDQLDALLCACRTVPGEIAGIPACLWWEGIHLCLWDTGARIGCLMRLEWADVDLDNATVVLRAENQKHRADQIFPLHPDTVAHLRKMKLPKRRLVFPWDRAACSLWPRYKAVLEGAGLPSDRRSMFHRVRRSVASYCELCGLNATTIMGHSSRKVTLAYLDPRVVGMRGPAQVLFRPAG